MKIQLSAVLILMFSCLFFTQKIITEEKEVIKPPKIKKLADNIVRIVFPYKLRTNTGVYTGKDGVIVIDPGFKEVSKELKTVIQNYSSKDLKFIINTHNHGDHRAGNIIQEKNTRIIGFKYIDNLVKDGILKRVDQKLGSDPLCFNYYYKLKKDGEEIRIIPATGTHSPNDIITHFIKHKIVFMGDLLLSESFPAVSREIRAYIKILKKTINVFPDDVTFVSGHGKDLNKQGLKDYLKMLFTTREIILKEIKSGKKLNQIQEKKLLRNYEKYDILLDWLGTKHWIETVFKYFRD